ncbi:MAG: hypothetical protein NTV38_02040 [Chloroflexi bacterium]|nr:hypothetical protein [Chloroflexota bacterium]
MPNNVGFDRVNPYPAGVSGPLRVQDISIRRSCPRQQGSGSKFGLPPTPHSLGNQVTLIFGHRPSDLKQELVMGITRTSSNAAMLAASRNRSKPGRLSLAPE